ncbi:hypothetical protein NNO07_03430 [Pseudomonas resinovorans]|uniref:Tetratricopeptide repeat protein n=1 Tax=Metapseudomonas resinovorans TaxID=53412 RepID=A0ABT4XZU5_METRE|nr:hypothetical protein [Pseudomonas resinovorans]MDA8482105.1 hypothetical protein [Pseudomonas resinovorans]
MSTPERRTRLALAIALCLPVLSAQACGPDFPLSLLDDRAQTLAELPEGNFAFEVARLGKPVPGLGQSGDATLVGYWDDGGERYLQQRDEVEQKELGEPLYQQVRRLRVLTDARQVEDQGLDLPAELRLYSAGAVAFAQQDYQLAADYFQRVLQLPPEQRRLRSTWAAYSLGRAQASLGNPEGVPAEETQRSEEDQRLFMRQATEAARDAFSQTRQLTAQGYSDPLELGIASLGEEARLAYLAGDWASAIRLYASQTAHHSATGYSSLRQLSAELIRLPDEQLMPLLAIREVQQLLTARLLSRLDGEPNGDDRIGSLLIENTGSDLDNADRLAALSYQFGRYDDAQRLLAKAGDSGLAWWLRAKLALRDGDATRAAEAYAKAARAFPEDEDWGTRRTANWDYENVKPRCRVDGENAILSLQRGDYLDAFDLLYRSGELYWWDAAAVAERVLTLEELKGYVDAKVAAAKPQTAEERESYQPRPIAAQLRDLLARRLLREGHYAEALPYYDSDELRETARRYGHAREEAENRWTATGRAEALYEAAVIAREQGMELLGYEMSPDFHSLGGSFALLQVDRQKASGLLSADEAERQNANLAQPNTRYHYRWVAAQLADRAADQLPRSSQAFAAVLCKATGWLLYRDLEGARVHYRRYVQQGPYVPWAVNFGQNCEEPDFDAAAKRVWEERGQWLRSSLHPWKYLLTGTGVLAIAAMILWMRRRRGE